MKCLNFHLPTACSLQPAFRLCRSGKVCREGKKCNVRGENRRQCVGCATKKLQKILELRKALSDQRFANVLATCRAEFWLRTS